MPHTLRQVDRDSEVLSALKVLAGFDEDLARETTRALNRIRPLLTQIHPALERVFTGGSLSTALVLDLLEKFGGSTRLKLLVVAGYCGSLARTLASIRKR